MTIQIQGKTFATGSSIMLGVFTDVTRPQLNPALLLLILHQQSVLNKHAIPAALEFETATTYSDTNAASSSIQLFKHHLRQFQGAKTMEDKTRWISSLAARNRDQETEKKPTQGAQDINRQGQGGNVQQGQLGQRDQPGPRKEACMSR